MKTLSKQDIVDRLLPLSPYKVILLGSRAWGTPGPDSDSSSGWRAGEGIRPLSTP